MPLFAALFSAISSSIFGLIVAAFGAKIAVRLTAVASVAALYAACVAVFNGMISPWIEAIFSTQYGQLLGLLFPPVSGTIMASLIAYWTSVLAFKYFSSLTKMALG